MTVLIAGRHILTTATMVHYLLPTQRLQLDCGLQGFGNNLQRQQAVPKEHNSTDATCTSEI